VTCIDRYIFAVFFRTLLVCFLSFGGIFVIFHAFTNMDDLNQYAERGGGIFRAMVHFYGPYMFLLFELTGAIVTLVAMLFTIGLLRRSGELTAILSAGVGHGRIVRPMMWGVVMMLAMSVINRELLLPRWQDQLGMKVRFGEGENSERQVLPVYDRISGILINGRAIRLGDEEILNPSFKLHSPVPGFGNQIHAASAAWMPATTAHPAGYLLRGVESPSDIDSLASVEIADGLSFRTAHDTSWVGAGECFVASDVPIDFLQSGTGWMRMARTADLIRRVSNPAIYCAADVRVTLHDRWLRPFLDLSLIVLSLALVIGRADRNLFVVTGYAMLLVAFFFALRTLAHMMGGSGYLIDPATAAWLPLIILAPLAYTRFRTIQNC